MTARLQSLLNEYFSMLPCIPQLGNASPTLDLLAPDTSERIMKSDSDFHDFVCRSYPVDAVGGSVRFHGFKELEEEHRDLYPALELIHQGFLCIAKDPDGSQYCYHLDEGAIYHLDNCGPTELETSEQSLDRWVSFEDFIEWLILNP